MCLHQGLPSLGLSLWGKLGEDMNLFDIIGSNRQLQEEHVTAVLAWLLDPYQSHGCGIYFLKKVLDRVQGERFSRLLDSWDETVRKRSGRCIDVDVVMEMPVNVQGGTKSKRSIDIVLLLTGMDDDKSVIAIENKIRGESVESGQLVDICKGLSNDETVAGVSNRSIIYLTPSKSSSSEREFEQLSDVSGFYRKHLFWNDQGVPDDSLVSILNQSIEDENKGEINPFSYETKFVIKSFIMYIKNGFNPKSPRMTRSSAFDFEVAEGLEELKVKASEDPMIFVGFCGGKKALAKAKDDELAARRYKWIKTLPSTGVNENNWIPWEDFSTIISRPLQE